MDWPSLDLELSESTFGYFRYGQRMCTIVRKLVTDEVSWNKSVENTRSQSSSHCADAQAVELAF
jgi:hypothetical protein